VPRASRRLAQDRASIARELVLLTSTLGDEAMRLPMLTGAPADLGTARRSDERKAEEMPSDGVQPQRCCAEVCVRTPFGEKCHCSLELPICP
jgi:hypothetical protein